MLRPEQDAYGRLIHDYLAGEEAVEIVERDDGYIDSSSGPRAYTAPFDEWPEHQREAMAYLRGPVLDVGSGAGRVSLYAQEHGMDVLATDNSPLALEACRARGVRRTQPVPITRLSPALGQFATIVMCGNNFGLMGNRARGRWLLRRFRGMTTPDARIIAESCDPHQTSNPYHLRYQEHNRARGRMPGQVRIRVRHRTLRTPWFDYLLVSVPEMEDILSGTGWELERVFTGSGGPYAAVIRRLG